MSAITVGGDLVHYEVLGRGRPVILVHGWLGSWRYWVPTMQQLNLKYRVYALDLFGFGDSGKNPEKYTIAHQVKLLDEFMKQLGVPKAAMIGHGLGAMVLTEFAMENPDKVARMLISSVPLYDPGDLQERTPAGQLKLLTVSANTAEPESQLTPLTQNSGDTTLPTRPPLATSEATVARRPENSSAASAPHDLPTVPRVGADVRTRLEEAARAAGESASKADSEIIESNAEKLDRLASIALSNQNPLLETLGSSTLANLLSKCFKTTEPAYEKLKVDVDKTDGDVLKHSVKHYDSGRMLDALRMLPMPIVLVHGEDDTVIPLPNEEVWHYLTVDKEDLLLPIPLPGVRHFPMLENDQFIRLANQFLEIADISKLEVKERWVRRTR